VPRHVRAEPLSVSCFESALSSSALSSTDPCTPSGDGADQPLRKVGHQTRDRGHGRRETRTVKAITLHTPGGIGFPHAQQAIRITRTRTNTGSGKTSRETAYLTISLPAADAHPADLQEWIRREWHIEALHHIRDVTFHEDSHQARTGNGPAIMATLRNDLVHSRAGRRGGLTET
jgi:predicted transposase YbfD/YdcC